MPPINAKCPLKMVTNGNVQGTFGIDHGHLALTGDRWHWLGTKWHWLGTNGIDWEQMALTERTFGIYWIQAPPPCSQGQMSLTGQCQMSLNIVMGYPFDHSHMTIWTNQRSAFDTLVQWEPLISARFMTSHKFGETNGIDQSMRNVPSIGVGDKWHDWSMPNVPP